MDGKELKRACASTSNNRDQSLHVEQITDLQ